MAAAWPLDHFDGVDMSDGEARDREMWGVDDWGFTWRPGYPLPRGHPMRAPRGGGSSSESSDSSESSEVVLEFDFHDIDRFDEYAVQPAAHVHHVSPWEVAPIVMAVIVVCVAYWMMDVALS